MPQRHHAEHVNQRIHNGSEQVQEQRSSPCAWLEGKAPLERQQRRHERQQHDGAGELPCHRFPPGKCQRPPLDVHDRHDAVGHDVQQRPHHPESDFPRTAMAQIAFEQHGGERRHCAILPAEAVAGRPDQPPLIPRFRRLVTLR